MILVYLFGHIGITLFLATTFSLPLLFVLIGVLLPDIVDKSLFFTNTAPCPRFIGHTLLFTLIVSLPTYLITRRISCVIGLIFGSYLHLLEDVYEHMVPWFYPLIKYEFICPPTYEIVFTPYIIVTEIIGFTLLLTTIRFKSRLKGLFLNLRKTK